MVNVFEKGNEIQTGSHGEHDYVYASGERVTDQGDSNFVFESGTGLGGALVIDNFERGDLNPYSSQTGSGGGSASITTSQVFEGTYAAKTEADSSISTISTSGLQNYPVVGDTFEVYTYLSTANGECNGRIGFNNLQFRYSVRTDGNANSTYGVDLPGLAIQDPNGNAIVQKNVTITTDAWVRIEITIGSPTISCSYGAETISGDYTLSSSDEFGIGGGANVVTDDSHLAYFDSAYLL